MSLPPGPRTHKAINAAGMLLARKAFLEQLRRRFGDAATMDLPRVGKTVVVFHPDLVKQVYTAPPDVLHGGKNPLGEVLGPGSLFAMDEDRHLEERRLLLPPLHGDRMRAYESIIEEEARRELARWPEDTDFATLPSFNRITLRIILRAVFGAEGTQLTDLEELLPRATALGQRLVTAPFLRRDLGPLSPGGRLARMRAEGDAVVFALIDERWRDPRLDERADILSLMLRSLRDEGTELDRQAVADELMGLLVAGHETTASSLAWAIERLRRHPDVVRRLEEEAATDGSALRTSTILELQRHRTIIAMNGRFAMQPFRLAEWDIPAGTVILAGGIVIHQDERFHDDAGAFKADRYVDAKPGTYSWIPFGGGRRRCLGAAFALFEMDVVLRTVLRQFELVPTTQAPERQSFKGVAYAPGKGGVGRVRRRSRELGEDAAPKAGRVSAAA
jgi:cytochrome P450 family 138